MSIITKCMHDASPVSINDPSVMQEQANCILPSTLTLDSRLKDVQHSSLYRFATWTTPNATLRMLQKE
jgi:hypothetical protein